MMAATEDKTLYEAFKMDVLDKSLDLPLADVLKTLIKQSKPWHYYRRHLTSGFIIELIRGQDEMKLQITYKDTAIYLFDGNIKDIKLNAIFKGITTSFIIMEFGKDFLKNIEWKI